MEKIILNETPVRTSNNFNINNISLEKVNIPDDIGKFENIKITNEYANISENNNEKFELRYGIGKDFENQVTCKSNKDLTITIDEKIKKDIEIDFNFDNNNINLIDNIHIIANENSDSNIILKYESKENIKGYHNGIIRLTAKENANVNITIVNLMSKESINLMSIESNIYANAKSKYTLIDFGGKYSIINYYSNLKEEFSSNKIEAMYLENESQVFDFNYIVELFGEKSNVNIEAQGALNDNAKKHFKGTIDLKKGCKKSIGNEEESCMLLSDTAKSLTLPMLLCSEEDVQGNHSSSAGKINNKELFYIMSRGFSLKEAMILMVKAKFNSILENIKSEELRQKILNEIDIKLG